MPDKSVKTFSLPPKTELVTHLSFFVAGTPQGPRKSEKLDKRIGEKFISGIYDGAPTAKWKHQVAIVAQHYLRNTKFERSDPLNVHMIFAFDGKSPNGWQVRPPSLILCGQSVIDTLVEVELIPCADQIVSLNLHKAWVQVGLNKAGVQIAINKAF